MIVWRFEHKDTGLGPYNSKCDADEIAWMRRSHNGDDHPTRYEEPGMSYWESKLPGGHHSCYYGCSTRAQLLTWFKNYLLDLWANGYRIRQYNVPDDKAFVRPKQISFLRSAATRL